MSANKFTPGPWVVQMHKARNWRVEAPRVDSVVLPPLPIAMVIGPNQNAHLIAAAPDMLEELERSTALLRRELAALDPEEAPYAIQTIKTQIERNDAAIKKARGEK